MEQKEENDNFRTELTMVEEADKAPPCNIVSSHCTEMTIQQTAGNSANSMEYDTKATQDDDAGAFVPAGILQPGDLVDKYRVIRMIGKGGMGNVYLVKHVHLGVPRALKVLSRSFSDDNQSFVQRFIQEAKMASTISNKHIVSVVDVDIDKTRNLCYIVMEYIDGGTLRDILRSAKNLSETEAAIIIAAVAEALVAASEHQIIHRDIKPDNIMLTRRGEIKLADLGIAKSGNEDIMLTKSHVMMGTPAYLSPEQAKDARSVDTRADIYSLGATYFEILTQRLPYPGKSAYEILGKLFAEPVPDPRAINENISAPVAKIIMKMLAKKPSDRYNSAQELLQEINKLSIRPAENDERVIVKTLLENIGSGKYVPTQMSTFSRTAGSRWKIMMPVILFLLLISAGTVYGLYYWGIVDNKTISNWSFFVKYTPPPIGNVAAETVQRQLKNQGSNKAETSLAALPAVESSEPLSPAMIAQSADANNKKPSKLSTSPVAAPSPAPAPEIAIEPVKCSWEISPVNARVVIHEKNGTTVVENRVAGDGKFTFELTPGTYKVTISHPGYSSLAQLLVIPAGQNQFSPPTAKLEPQTGDITLLIPVGAEAVLLQGTTRVTERIADDRGAVLFKNVPVGVYRIEVSCTGYERCKETVEVRDLQNSYMKFEMKNNTPPVKIYAPRATMTDGDKGVVETVKIQRPDPQAVCVVRLLGDENLLTYIRKKGCEIKIDDGNWQPVTVYPCRLQLARGKHTIIFNACGVQPPTAQEVDLSNTNIVNADFNLQGEPAVLELECKYPDATINLGDKWQPLTRNITVKPFTELTLQCKVKDFPVEITKIKPLNPREHRLIRTNPKPVNVPGDAEYQEGVTIYSRHQYDLSLEKFIAAASKKHPDAAYQVGLMHETGKGRWFCSDKDALQWYQAAADSVNNANALFKIGLFYEEGRGSLVKDMKSAAAYYQKAAARLQPDALFHLGSMYKNGDGGLPVLPEEAVRLFRKAADLDQIDAQCMLGVCFENGFGVPVNIAVALDWYRMAAKKENKEAIRRMELLEKLINNK